MPRYKAPWLPMEKNEAFWREVLVGRKITDIEWVDDYRLAVLVLDNGERVQIHQNTVMVKVE